MKLFGGIYLTLCLVQLSVQQYGSNSHRWGLFRNARSGGGDSDDWPSASVVESDSPKQSSLRQKQIVQPASGPEDEPEDSSRPEPAQGQKRKQPVISNFLGKFESKITIRTRATSVKFVLRCPKGNVEKEEQVTIPAGRPISSRLQRVLEPTAGFITVVYRDSRGVLTRIEKLPLPEHLPKETIPAGGLVVNRTELPWEPSVNALEVEAEEVANDAKTLNNENQNVDESQSSSPTRVAQEGSYVRPSKFQLPDIGFTARKPVSSVSSIQQRDNRRQQQEYPISYVRPDDTSAPLRLKSSGY